MNILTAMLIMQTMNDSKINPKYEIKNNEIIPRTVCYNYKNGSIKYRMCRKKAVRIFKKKCKETKEKIYCNASRRVKPLY